jgi:hypothetical protein
MKNKSDIEILKEMFARSNLNFKMEDKQILTIEAGYVGFVSTFTFDLDGKLLKVESFE